MATFAPSKAIIVEMVDIYEIYTIRLHCRAHATIYSQIHKKLLGGNK